MAVLAIVVLLLMGIIRPQTQPQAAGLGAVIEDADTCYYDACQDFTGADGDACDRVPVIVSCYASYCNSGPCQDIGEKIELAGSCGYDYCLAHPEVADCALAPALPVSCSNPLCNIGNCALNSGDPLAIYPLDTLVAISHMIEELSQDLTVDILPRISRIQRSLFGEDEILNAEEELVTLEKKVEELEKETNR